MYAAATGPRVGETLHFAEGARWGISPMPPQTSLWVKAYAVAADREDTPSLRKMLLT
jgi:hypothetical protein